MNFIDVKLKEKDGVFLAEGKGGLAMPVDPGPFEGELQDGREVTLGVRPHEVEVVEGGAEGVPFEVSIIEALGAESYAHGSIGGAPVIARIDAGSGIKKGQMARVALRGVHLFDATSGVSLRTAKE